MRRHLPVLSHAFRFYAGWIAGISSLGAVLAGGALVWAGEPALAALFAALTLGFGWAFAAPFWATGRGLEARRPWARVLGVALSVLVVTDLPFGLGLGLLGIGTLLDDDVERAFRGEAPRTALTERQTTNVLTTQPARAEIPTPIT